MKNKNRTHPTFTTKTDTRYSTNIHPKTDYDQVNRKRTQMKISNVSYTLINPVPDRYNPKNQNVHRNEKRPFCVRF